MRSSILAGGLLLGLGVAAFTAGLGVRDGATQAPSAADKAPLRCVFHANDTAAFRFTSLATLEGQAIEDRFEGILRWTVVGEASADRAAVLRAALGQVTLKQEVSEERANADDLSDRPFYVRVDSTCRIQGLGFSPAWTSANRHLVEGLLKTAEIVLPNDAKSSQWEAEQEDGIGAYTGQYRASPTEGSSRIVRSKASYHGDEAARQMGIRVQVVGARTEARFDPRRSGGFTEITGREHVRLLLGDGRPRAFIHTYQMKRDDARYVAVSDALALEDADFTGATTPEEHVAPAADPALAAVDHDAALTRFQGFLRDSGKRGIYPASRYLAAWLKTHPDESQRLLSDLRNGAIDKAAHSSLFLAFELAGTKESGQALADALVDKRLSELNRARAAAALADHGDPTGATAEVLKAGARSRSSIVANASLLGLGRMAGRTHDGDPLKNELRSTLEAELAGAKTDEAAVAVIDALGNSRDGAFAAALDERIRSGSVSVRAHAAESLGRLPAEVARPRLVAQLEAEQSPGVSTAIVRSIATLRGTLGDAELTFAKSRLATSASTDERAAIIDWLGSARDQASARQALAAHFTAEPDVRLKQRIGMFVPPADLRMASR